MSTVEGTARPTREARIAAMRESLLPWVRPRRGGVRHVLAADTFAQHRTLCGLIFPATPTSFVWKGRTDEPAGQFKVCGNCANVARAIVEEADG